VQIGVAAGSCSVRILFLIRELISSPFYLHFTRADMSRVVRFVTESCMRPWKLACRATRLERAMTTLHYYMY